MTEQTHILALDANGQTFTVAVASIKTEACPYLLRQWGVWAVLTTHPYMSISDAVAVMKRLFAGDAAVRVDFDDLSYVLGARGQELLSPIRCATNPVRAGAPCSIY